MKETGLMFKAPLVRDILSDLKTQTRRAFSEHMMQQMRAAAAIGEVSHFLEEGTLQPNDLAYVQQFSPVGQPGDRIYVRETFVQGYEEDPLTGRLKQWDEEGNDIPMTTWYRATNGGITWSDDGESEVNVPLKPAIHMPKTLARIWLEITGVRVERLQAITDADALAEGVDRTNTSIPGYACERFRKLWETTGGDWAANPWVWVIAFKRIEKPR